MNKFAFYIYFILSSCLFLFLNPLFAKESAEFKVSGTIKGSSGTKVYLVDIGLFYRLIDNGIILDSCEIVDDKFEFKGNVEYPTFCAIKIPELTKTYKIFILEGGNTEISGDVEKLYMTYLVSDGTENKLYDKRNYEITSVDEQLNFIAEYPNSLVSLHVLDILVFNDHIDRSTAEKYFALLSEEVINTPDGKILQNRINLLKSINWTTLPSYEGLDINGKRISFEDFKDKYVIIDFWATWCEPCVEEMPKMVDIYNKHRDSIQIISVSLDRNIELCKSRAEELGMAWRNICNGDASRGQLPLLYDVAAVPRIVIYDKSQNLIFDSESSDQNFHDFISAKMDIN